MSVTLADLEGLDPTEWFAVEQVMREHEELWREADETGQPVHVWSREQSPRAGSPGIIPRRCAACLPDVDRMLVVSGAQRVPVVIGVGQYSVRPV